MGRAAAADPYRPGPPHALGTFMTTSAPPAVFSSIREVERDVGVAKETLRVWERRYGFPAPQRDPNGERVYPPEQAHKLTELRQRLSQAMLTMGMKRCVIELIAPLTTAVGLAWSQGSLAVFEEHLYADMLQTVLRNAIVAATAQRSDEPRPRVLLTTVPQERHSLGLLMAEVLLALDGAASISLGVQTPLADIVAAVRSQQADIVALSFSGVTSPRAAVDNINELRTRLGDDAEIWAGGAGVAMARRHLQPGTVLDLLTVGGAVARWREQHPQQAEPVARRA